MIVFNVIQDSEQAALEISNHVILKKYAVQTHIDLNTVLTLNERKQTVRLYFITRALLYDKIEGEILKQFYSNEIVIYASPVSHIQKEYGQFLRDSIL